MSNKHFNYKWLLVLLNNTVTKQKTCLILKYYLNYIVLFCEFFIGIYCLIKYTAFFKFYNVYIVLNYTRLNNFKFKYLNYLYS